MPLRVRVLKPGSLAGVVEIAPGRFEDARGYFSETYNQAELAQHGIESLFVQDNQSLSREEGTVRGLHFQIPPFAQTKLVRVLAGAILDVAVDIRVGSPTYGHHVSCELSEGKANQLLIPEGFAHGFCTLKPDTQVFYKVSQPYSREHDQGLLWNDPTLSIDWPVLPGNAIVSEKDLAQVPLKNLVSPFEYNEPART